MKRLLFTLTAALAALVCVVALAQQPRTLIGVAADGNVAASAVAPQLGRSSYFLLFNEQGALVQALANPYKDAANSGIPAVDLLAGKGVRFVVAQGFGGQIVSVMKAKGLTPVEFTGNAQDAAKRALESK